jgi:Tol biopolymer transport system component
MNPNRLTLIQAQVLSTGPAPAISGNGDLIAFASTDALLATDVTPGQDDIYVRDLETGTLSHVNIDENDVALGGINLNPVLSNTGSVIAFEHIAGGVRSIWVKETVTGTLVAGSTDATGTAADGASFHASLSSNGKYLAFISAGTNLTADDDNGLSDGFVKNLADQSIINVSMLADGTQANRATSDISVSGDGNVIVFTTAATNLSGSTAAIERVYIKNAASGELSVVSADAAGVLANGASYHASVSENGRYVVFTSKAFNLSDEAPILSSSIYRKDMQTGALMLVSTDASGHAGKGDSDMSVISADGRYVMFESTANLTPGDGDGKTDVFLKDTVTGSITCLSAGASADTDIGYSGFARNGLDAVFLGDSSNGVDVIQSALGSGFASLSNGTYKGDAARNVLLGAAGSDTFTGNGGNDLIDGGAGKDVAFYSGALSNYTVKKTDAGILITDARGVDGTDTVGNVELLRFADFNVSLDINGVAGKVYRLYQAAFDRTPDSGGLGYWIAQMDNGMTLNEVARQFFASTEAQGQYGINPDANTLITAMYDNVLHRTPDEGGAAHWLARLNSGLSAAGLLIEFSESIENRAALVGVMENGFAYTPF